MERHSRVDKRESLILNDYSRIIEIGNNQFMNSEINYNDQLDVIYDVVKDVFNIEVPDSIVQMILRFTSCFGIVIWS